MFLKKLFLPLALVLLLLPLACTEDETNLGVGLNDPLTLYSGTRDTIYMTGITVFDDSLSSSGYSSAALGYLSHDPVFGSVSTIVYSQIGAPKEGVNITDEVIVDSVVMTLVIDTVYPIMPDSTPRLMHLTINQLSEELKSDSAYFSTQKLAESQTCFFDDDITYYADSIRIRLRENIYPLLHQSCSQEEFLRVTKGFSLKLRPKQGEDLMLTLDFTATNTRMTMYYHTSQVANLKYEFSINNAAAHSMYFEHEYSGSVLSTFAHNRADSLEGSSRLYLEPLGGTKVRLYMQPYVSQFKKAHPNAVVHYAELVLPVAPESDTSAPVRILALKRHANGASAYITDANVLTNGFTYAGFDGYYNREKKQYRMRVSRHLQELFRDGKDYGTELVIDARRSYPFRAILEGTAGARPVMIDFVYSE